MESPLFSGVFELRGGEHVVLVLALTHVSIVAVTVFLHRHQAHRALDLHPAAGRILAAPALLRLTFPATGGRDPQSAAAACAC